jgi:hypothetical protein
MPDLSYYKRGVPIDESGRPLGKLPVDLAYEQGINQLGEPNPAFGGQWNPSLLQQIGGLLQQLHGVLGPGMQMRGGFGKPGDLSRYRGPTDEAREAYGQSKRNDALLRQLREDMNQKVTDDYQKFVTHGRPDLSEGDPKIIKQLTGLGQRTASSPGYDELVTDAQSHLHNLNYQAGAAPDQALIDYLDSIQRPPVNWNPDSTTIQDLTNLVRMPAIRPTPSSQPAPIMDLRY